MGMLERGETDEEIIRWVRSETENKLDQREVGHSIITCVLTNMISELGGAEALDLDLPWLIVPSEMTALRKHQNLMMTFLKRESDQAYSLFALQQLAQDLSYPKGLAPFWL